MMSELKIENNRERTMEFPIEVNNKSMVLSKNRMAKNSLRSAVDDVGQ